MTSAAARALALVGVAALLAGCGVPRQDDPRIVPDDRVPYRLLAPSAVGPPPATLKEPRVPLTVPHVYFVEGDQLVPEPVPLAATGAEPVLRQLLGRLAAGPTEEQRATGLESTLGFGLRLALADLAGGVATIEILGSAEPPSADRLPLAIGQVVLTATSVEGVDAVTLRRDGAPVNIPLPGGEQVAGPVTAAPYLSLLVPSGRRSQAPPTPAPSPSS